MVVGLAAFAIALVFAVRIVAAAGGDPTILIAFGEDATPTRGFAEQRLGEVYLRAGQGHDGKFFFVQAHDPLILDPDEYASVLDRPLYRSQRMLYPLLAGGFGVFGSESIAWSMLIVNLAAIGAGTFATARVAQHLGGSAWWGLAFAFNIGLISEVNISGAGVTAAALAFGAVAAALMSRNRLVVILLVLSALAREVFLIAAVGMAWWAWKQGDKRAAVSWTVTPFAAVGVWALFLRFQLGWEAVASQVEEVGWPLVGFIQAIPEWLERPLNLAAGLAVLLLFAVYIRRTLASDALVGWAFIGFVPLALLFTEQVWLNYFDITRAVAPLITSIVLLIFLSARSRHRGPLAAEPVA